MNKLISVFIAILMCSSCASKGEYTIKGLASTDLEGQTVYLMTQPEAGKESIDSVKIKGGKFSFSGIQEKPAIYGIAIGSSRDLGATLLVEPGIITVDATLNGIKVGGTPTNEAYQKHSEAVNTINAQIKEFTQKYSTVNPATLSDKEIEKINEEYMVFQNEMKKLHFNFVLENINNPIGEAVFLSLINHISTEEIEQVLNNAGEEFKSKEVGKAIIEMVNGNKRATQGQKFIDFTMPDPSGKNVSLSDFAGKGKYVLIDFWASWCGPCIREMPTMIEAYKLYKDKNFEIVGVSLDAQAAPWKAAIQKYNMTWVQMSDLKQWNCVARELYNFNSIPHTILLDPDGIIIAKDLRGKQLLEKLESLIH